MKFWRSSSELKTWRLLVLAAVIVALTLIHQVGGIQRSPVHQILDIVPYLPIILGALWFGVAGGVACALWTTACFTIHIHLHEGGAFLGSNLHRTLNILMFNVVGLVAGYLAQRQLETMAGYKKLAAELEKAYAQLREKTEQLFRNEENLQRASRLSALGELTAGLAHEIGNPLGGIKGAAEILADALPPNDPKLRFARLLLQEVKRLDEVVSRFLDFARPRERAEESADVREALRRVVSLCEQAVKNGRLSLEVKVEEGVRPAAASADEIEQVFLNLLLNAIQASRPGGYILLRARNLGDSLECLVKDDGAGIMPENLPRVFDPFFTTKPGGTGLGLAITHRIVEGCGGRISVESRPGQGAEFRVSLPVARTIGAEKEGAGRR